MKVRRAHKIALDPTDEQRDRFKRAAGTARFTWNWALAEWNRLFKAGGPSTGSGPDAMDLKKRFNAVKRTEFPWIYESPRDANSQPFADLAQAFRNFFDKRAERPTFKKKGKCRDSFYVSNDKFSLDGRSVRLPKIGRVKMREALRFDGKVLGARVSRTADRWFISIQTEFDLLPFDTGESQAGVVGMDLGLRHLAVLSDGTTFPNPRPLAKALRKLRRLSRQLSRKVKGSTNWHKAVRKLARLHARIASLRSDALHKLTTWLVGRYGHVVIEDLHVKGMMRNGRLARAIADVGWGELRRQLAYKAEAAGTMVTITDRWYPSSKTCSGCGSVKDGLTLKDRIYRCIGCGLTMDRDFNAAVNLERYPGLRGNHDACGHSSAGCVAPDPSTPLRIVEGGDAVKLGWTKQEFNA